MAGRGAGPGREDLGGSRREGEDDAVKHGIPDEKKEPPGLLKAAASGRGRRHSTRPRAATRHSASTVSPRTASTRSCRFDTTQAWLGRTRTRSPTRNRSPVLHGDDAVLLAQLARRGCLPAQHPAVTRRRAAAAGSVESVLLPASRTARSGAGTLTTVASDGHRAVFEAAGPERDLRGVVVDVVARPAFGDAGHRHGVARGRRGADRDLLDRRAPPRAAPPRPRPASSPRACPTAATPPASPRRTRGRRA